MVDVEKCTGAPRHFHHRKGDRGSVDQRGFHCAWAARRGGQAVRWHVRRCEAAGPPARPGDNAAHAVSACVPFPPLAGDLFRFPLAQACALAPLAPHAGRHPPQSVRKAPRLPLARVPEPSLEGADGAMTGNPVRSRKLMRSREARGWFSGITHLSVPNSLPRLPD